MTRTEAQPHDQHDRHNRRRRWPLVVSVLGLAAILGVAVIDARGPQTPSLDPGDHGPDGTWALVEILRAQGVRVDVVTSSMNLPDDNSSVLVTEPESLSTAALDRLASGSGPLVLVLPDKAALRRLAPGIVSDGIAVEVATPTSPGCGDGDARAAGEIDWRFAELFAADETDPPAAGTTFCYHDGANGSGGRQAALGVSGSRAAAAAEDDDTAEDEPSPSGLLVRTTSGSRAVDVLGVPDVLTNEYLDDAGDAALALRLTGRTPRLVWYTPTGEDALGEGDTTLGDLIPDSVRWSLWQLLLAVGVALLWAGRRDARLVTEPLPVIVRAAETEEGRARLYVRAGAHDRSAAILRTATLRRLAHRLDVPAGAAPDLVASLVAAHTGRALGEVSDVLLGAPPFDDAALLALARALDDLEREVAGPTDAAPIASTARKAVRP